MFQDNMPYMPRRLPVIDITDLYHPHQDPGDNFDLVAAYALPEIELKAVILDCTAAFCEPESADNGGPRAPGLIPVWQLNAIFGRTVPCGITPLTPLRTPNDAMQDAPQWEQSGVELLLETLRQSEEQVHITCFSSARALALAWNREPNLMREKVARIHLSAGSSAPVERYREWNVALDPHAMTALLRSDLPIAIYPCAAGIANGNVWEAIQPAFSYDEHNSFYSLPNLEFINEMQPELRRYLEFAFSKAQRLDFLRAIQCDDANMSAAANTVFQKPHSVWETAVWMELSQRRLVKRENGFRLLPTHLIKPTEMQLPHELRPVALKVGDDGIFTASPAKTSNFSLYFRGDPWENEVALREALPALYREFRT